MSMRVTNLVSVKYQENSGAGIYIQVYFVLKFSLSINISIGIVNIFLMNYLFDQHRLLGARLF